MNLALSQTKILRLVGVFLATLLILTLIQFAPGMGVKALADSTPHDQPNQNPGGTSNLPTSLVLTASNDFDNANSTITALASTDVADSGSVVYLYKQGDSNPVDSGDSGKQFTFHVARPATGVDQYYAQVNDIKSNTVPVANTNSAWQVTISMDTNAYGTDDPTPQVTWHTNQSLTGTGYAIYLTENNQTFTYTGINSGDSGTVTVPRQGGIIYAYIASYTGEDYPLVSHLSNIQNVSESTYVMTKAWTATLSLDKDTYGTDDATPQLSWTLNQSVSGSGGALALYIYSDNSLVYCSTGAAATGTINVPRAYGGSGTTHFTAYVANYSGVDGEGPDDLVNIQAQSNTVSTSLAAWNMSVTLDKTIYGVDDDTPTISWHINQDVASAHLALYLFAGDGEVWVNQNPRENGSASLPRSLSGGPVTYKMYVANYDGVWNLNKSDLQNIVAESNEVTVSLLPWTVSLTGNNTIFTTGGDQATLHWHTNQSINKSNYALYIFDGDSEAVVVNGGGTDGDYTVPKFEGTAHFTAYVAPYDGVNSLRLSDIQSGIVASSNMVQVSSLPWSLRLSSQNLGAASSSTTNVKFTVQLNQPDTNNGNSVYIVDNQTGGVIANLQGGNATATALTYTAELPNSDTDGYTAYLGNYNGVWNIGLSDISNIRAHSNTIYPLRVYNADEMIGGSNPSEATCRLCDHDPIDTATGELIEANNDITLASHIPFELTRSYTESTANTLGAFGYGWHSSYDMRLNIGNSQADGTALTDATQLKIGQENGSVVTFDKGVDGSYMAPLHTFATLKHDVSANTFIFTRSNGYTFTFDDTTGVLKKIVDRNGNALTFSYDAAGQLTKVQNDQGRFLTFTWNTGVITQVADDTGRTVTYGYDNDQNLTSVSSLTSVTGTAYGYDGHKLTSLTNTQGETTTNEYSGDRVVKQTRPDGKYVTYAYTTLDNGNLQTMITEEDGSHTQDIYNANLQLISTDPAYDTGYNIPTTYTYGNTGQVTQVKDPLGYVTTYTYDDQGNLLTSTDPENQTTTYTYNAFNEVLTTTDPANNTSTNLYDSNGNLVSATDYDGNETKYVVNDDGTPASAQAPQQVKDQDSAKALFAYDVNGLLKETTTPRGNTTHYTDNTLGQPLTITDAKGNVTQYAYDTLNRLHSITYPDGGQKITTYYDSGLVHTVTDQMGHETTYTYDILGNVHTIVTAAGTTTYTYTDLNKLKSVTDYDNRTTSYTYDPWGRRKTTTDPNGNVTETDYSPNGWLGSVNDAVGNATQKSRVTLYVHSPDGYVVDIYRVYIDYAQNIFDFKRFAGYNYDQDNNRIAATDADNVTTHYTYDNDGRLLKTIANDQSYTENHYDANGNIVKVTDAAGNDKTYAYDQDNDLTSETDQGNHTTTYTYNSLDQNEQTTRPDSTKAYYSYTPMGQPYQVSYDNWTSVDTTRTYNLDGQSATETKGDTETDYAYDAVGNLTYRGPPVHANDTSAGVTYTYDQGQNVSGITYPDGISLAYGYDPAGNLTTVKQGNTTLASYAYDQDNNPTSVAYANNTTQTYTYDNYERLSKIQVTNANGNLYNKELTHDDADLLTGATTTTGDGSTTGTTSNIQYAYDSVERLNQVTVGSGSTATTVPYGFDTRGNRTTVASQGAMYNTDDQVTTANTGTTTTAYTYNDRGDLTEKQDSDTTGTTPTVTADSTYTWTSDDLLASVTPGNATYGYTYDASGLLASKTTTVNSPTATPATINFVWDESGDLATMLEDDTNSYLYGVGITPFAQINKSTGVITYLYGDDLGSVVLTVDGSGDQVSQYTYDEYGKLKQHIGDSGHTVTPFGYAGQYQDENSGLYYMRARWYDPNSGLFISIDPAVRKTNIAYSYAEGRPNQENDPSGLISIGPCLTGSAAFVVVGVSAQGCPLITTIDDRTGEISFGGTYTEGGGLGYFGPLDASVSLVAQISNARTINQLGSWFDNLGGTADVAGGISGDVFTGKTPGAPGNRVIGIEGGPAAGAGLTVNINRTYTWTAKYYSFNPIKFFESIFSSKENKCNSSSLAVP